MGGSVPLGENYQIKSWEGVTTFQQQQNGRWQTYLLVPVGQDCLLTKIGVPRHGKRHVIVICTDARMMDCNQNQADSSKFAATGVIPTGSLGKEQDVV